MISEKGSTALRLLHSPRHYLNQRPVLKQLTHLARNNLTKAHIFGHPSSIRPYKKNRSFRLHFHLQYSTTTPFHETLQGGPKLQEVGSTYHGPALRIYQQEHIQNFLQNRSFFTQSAQQAEIFSPSTETGRSDYDSAILSTFDFDHDINEIYQKNSNVKTSKSSPSTQSSAYTKGINPKMSSGAGFSNADTGSKNPDPYKEKNKEEDLSLSTKISDLVTFIKGCKFGMMTTRDSKSGMLMSRCMALAAEENGGIDLLFHTNTESGKTHDLSTDGHINIAFLNASGEWASLSGTASVLTDRSIVHKYYSPSLKAWIGDLGDGKHDGGPEDPRIGIIKVDLLTATYAIVRKNLVNRLADVAQGTITGNAPSVNKLREITEDEVKQWRGIHRGESEK